jgi:protein-L-isoaspartate(D-aspartate) O-methyltransferase
MVREQLEARGIVDPRVLEAFRRVPREQFMAAELAAEAYEDGALPIECGQTISQPYMVGLMTQSLRLQGWERVLEIGTGSGYQAAILALLAREVYTVERHPTLQVRARLACDALGLTNIRYRTANGVMGWPEAAPFDAIVVTAGAPTVPVALLEQLGDGGRLVIPVGPMEMQSLLLILRSGDRFEHESLAECRFVPLIGEEGWPDLPRSEPARP